MKTVSLMINGSAVTTFIEDTPLTKEMRAELVATGGQDYKDVAHDVVFAGGSWAFWTDKKLASATRVSEVSSDIHERLRK